VQILIPYFVIMSELNFFLLMGSKLQHYGPCKIS
jgi:hypothetical protein